MPPKQRVQITLNEIPSPMATKVLTRKLIEPWRRTENLESVETQLPNNQIWTQLHTQCFELQAISKMRGDPPNTDPGFESPYPQ